MINPFSEEIKTLLGDKVRFGTDASGNNLSVHCPFHKGGQERKPSMYVYVGPATPFKHPGMSFCHTCNEGWSLTHLMRKLGVGGAVIEAARQIAEEAKPRKRLDRLRSGLDFDFTNIPEEIMGLFEYTPKALLEEGFNKDLLKKYEIGFDRKRKRIIFPIRSHTGDLVGLSGRTVRGEFPRYKIYRQELHEILPNYALKKGKVLWGLNRFYQQRLYTSTPHPLVVCEGFKAALWCVQHGYPHTVALIGSHMSTEQEILLTRVSNEVVLFLDNDEAGIKAASNIMKRLNGTEVRIANYGTNEPISPDDLDKTGLQHAIGRAWSPLEWRRLNE